MREASRTTRERITDRLREEPLTVSGLAREFELNAATTLTHVEHIAKTLDQTDQELLVAPPECRDCGFDRFDDLINRPSRCPDCKSEAIEEPAFRVR
ncbi:transcriptional regulator [Halovenus rubra]|uniref:Transcriptional regulator n=2 Tax=Halovenus rubra TaxID=869890 RepID=A0ABD5X8F6_9EURY|nr:transcriptional regulator [Halovenus rubra]